MLQYIRRLDHATACGYRPLCDKTTSSRALLNFVLNKQAKALIAPSRLPAPAIGSFPFSVAVGVGPDCSGVWESWKICIFLSTHSLSPLANVVCLFPCRNIDRHRYYLKKYISAPAPTRQG
jgi:hypothetical protein